VLHVECGVRDQWWYPWVGTLWADQRDREQHEPDGGRQEVGRFVEARAAVARALDSKATDSSANSFPSTESERLPDDWKRLPGHDFAPAGPFQHGAATMVTPSSNYDAVHHVGVPEQF
jgi:hypothetical protein